MSLTLQLYLQESWVLKLIAGPEVNICNKCVDVSIGIVLEEVAENTGELKDMPNLESLVREAQDKEK